LIDLQVVSVKVALEMGASAVLLATLILKRWSGLSETDLKPKSLIWELH